MIFLLLYNLALYFFIFKYKKLNIYKFKLMNFINLDNAYPKNLI